ncbi:MAG: PilZ domain-containing protein [Desulfomicrobium sp.]|nr:PilZ domain-containing protein [Desulfomicrobium sp.]NLV95795.1 PilZ domain-containing protein [Desulfovibrionales bacterium]
MSGHNRRQWQRYAQEVHILWTRSLQEGDRVGIMVNFSRGGLCLVHAEPLEKGQRILLRLPQTMAGLSKDVWAQVAWCVPMANEKYALGLKYENPLLWTRYR